MSKINPLTNRVVEVSDVGAIHKCLLDCDAVIGALQSQLRVNIAKRSFYQELFDLISEEIRVLQDTKAYDKWNENRKKGKEK